MPVDSSKAHKSLIQRLWGDTSEDSVPEMTPEAPDMPAAGQQTQHWTPRLQAQLTHFWKINRTAAGTSSARSYE